MRFPLYSEENGYFTTKIIRKKINGKKEIVMKFIQSIETLMERAERRGIACLRRDNKEVYSVSVDENKSIYRLFHYHTLTASVKADERKVLFLYGESASDRDSVNTFLSLLYINVNVAYRPVNGGFCASFEGIEYNELDDDFYNIVNENRPSNFYLQDDSFMKIPALI